MRIQGRVSIFSRLSTLCVFIFSVGADWSVFRVELFATRILREFFFPQERLGAQRLYLQTCAHELRTEWGVERHGGRALVPSVLCGGDRERYRVWGEQPLFEFLPHMLQISRLRCWFFVNFLYFQRMRIYEISVPYDRHVSFLFILSSFYHFCVSMI